MTVAIDDDLWSAIGDPTRRRMLDLLLTDPGPPERYAVSLRWYADDLVGAAERGA